MKLERLFCKGKSSKLLKVQGRVFKLRTSKNFKATL